MASGVKGEDRDAEKDETFNPSNPIPAIHVGPASPPDRSAGGDKLMSTSTAARRAAGGGGLRAGATGRNDATTGVSLTCTRP